MVQHLAAATAITAAATTDEPSAAEEVFNITELFEFIFERVEFHDLIRSRRVSQTFLLHIKKSAPLQRRLSWLQIEPPSRTLYTFLNFQLCFPHYKSHGPFSMGHSGPTYSRSGQDELLYLHFHNRDPTSPESGRLQITPDPDASWRSHRIADNDVRICITYDDDVSTYGHELLKAGSTLGDVYDWLCKKQELTWQAIEEELSGGWALISLNPRSREARALTDGGQRLVEA